MPPTSSSKASRLPLALFILTLGTFTIGTSEFVIMGLLPEVAQSLSVTIPAAGWLVTGYALGIAIGAPLIALATVRMPRKTSLLLLMFVFLVGNVLCALALNYGHLMVARIITSLGQGAFFGIGAVVAAGLVPEERRASAIAVMFAGLTLANIVGVPLGTSIGHWAGWRVPFWVIALMSLVALVGLWRAIPFRADEERINVRSELQALKNAQIWMALATTIVFLAAVFTLFTYASAMLSDITQMSPNAVSVSLLLIGLGMMVGSIVGGRMADRSLSTALVVIAVGIAVISLALRWTSHNFYSAGIVWFIWGIVTFAPVPALQVSVMRFGHAAPNLVSTLNIAAFNVGIALGARVGGSVLDAGYTLLDLPVAAAVLAGIALVGTIGTEFMAKRTSTITAAS